MPGPNEPTTTEAEPVEPSDVALAGTANAVLIDDTGNVGIGTSTPGATLDVVGDVHASGDIDAKGITGDGTKITVNGPTALQAALDAKLDKAGGTISGALAVNTVVPPVKGGHALVDVSGGIQAQNLLSTNPMQHRMYPGDPVVHQDIFEAQTSGAITKLGNPTYDDTTYTSLNPWNKRPIIAFGSNNEADGNGAVVTIPPGYDTVWLRVLGDRWNAIHAYFTDNPQTDLGVWTAGKRYTNCYCPDGSTSDGDMWFHQWVPIPAGRSGELALISKPVTTGYFWLSGVAFSRNPWAHAAQSAMAFNWTSNGGDVIAWNVDNNNNDVLAQVNGGTNLTMKVPVVATGRDKLLYAITLNPNYNDVTHTGITVNGNAIERFITTYDNPFARHWNSKPFERYVAARIPANLVPQGTPFLDVKVDRTYQPEPMYIREAGTHDLEVPWSG